MQTGQYQTIKNTARISGLPVHAVRTLVKSGKVRMIYSGNRCYVDTWDLCGKLDAESRKDKGNAS